MMATNRSASKVEYNCDKIEISYNISNIVDFFVLFRYYLRPVFATQNDIKFLISLC